MLITERSDIPTPPPGLLLPDQDGAAVTAAGPALAPFEILGESIVPDVTQVPLILQGTFIQVTNTGGNAIIRLQYQPTVPFVAAPSGGKIKLTANVVNFDLTIYDITKIFVDNPAAPLLTFGVPAGRTIIVGVQYVATPLIPKSPGLAATEAAGNRGVVRLIPDAGSTFVVTATVRQVFVNQQTLAPIAAAAYAVSLSGGPVVSG